MGIVIIHKLYVLASLCSYWTPRKRTTRFLPPAPCCMVRRSLDSCVRLPVLQSWLYRVFS